MALVRDNLDEIRDMFSDIELDAFLNSRLQTSVELTVDYILENRGQFSKKRKRTHDKTSMNDHEDTLVLSDSSISNNVFDEDIDFSDPKITSFFDALSSRFDQVMTLQEPTFTADQISELVSYFSKKFTQVRLPTFRWLISKELGLDALLLILFFVENHAVGVESFRQIISKLINERSRRDSVGPSVAGSVGSLIQTKLVIRIQTKLEPLIKPRKFIDNAQINDNLLKRAVDDAINSFEEVLLRSLKSINSSKSLSGIRWMGKSLSYLANKMGEKTFECMVCFTEYSISKAFYCTNMDSGANYECKDVHPFCIECVKGQAEASINEALLSEGALGLRCMASDCKNPILYSNIRLYLSHSLRSHLEKRITNQAICSAGLSNLEFCLRCDFAMVMEAPKDVDKVFQCQNCDYSFCRLCEEEWAKHFGLTCDELKEKSEDSKRRELEKKLNEAVVRSCPNCHLQFVKLEACNKMTCRCGVTQCYICRKVGIAYDHFCNHVRDPAQPNKKCEQCKVPRCLLWEDFKKRDNDALERILKEADVNVNVPKSPVAGTSKQGNIVRPQGMQAGFLVGGARPHFARRPPPMHVPADPRPRLQQNHAHIMQNIHDAQQLVRQMHVQMQQNRPQIHQEIMQMHARIVNQNRPPHINEIPLPPPQWNIRHQAPPRQ